MAGVTAKAVLKTVTLGKESADLKFEADYADGRNKEWAPWTPALSFSMTVKTEVYEKNFELGGSYVVTFQPDPA